MGYLSSATRGEQRSWGVWQPFVLLSKFLLIADKIGMKILVTGGAGYIGSHTVHQLVNAGRKVIVLDDLSSGHPESLPSSVPLVKGNVGDKKLVLKLLREHEINSVIHFAAFTRVDESVMLPLKYYEN